MADIYHDYSHKVNEITHTNDATQAEENKKQLDPGESEKQFNNFTMPKNNSTTHTTESECKQVYYGINNTKETYCISNDHCYARPWNWKPESTFLRPTKTLFMSATSLKLKCPGELLLVKKEPERDVDIESEPNDPLPIYDVENAKQLMEECDNHVQLFKYDEGSDQWEESVSKHNWTSTQTRLFNGVVSILNNHLLVKLSSIGVNYEAINRRTAIDKSVQRFRRLLATVFWDQKVTQWLHQLLVDHLSTEYLGIYLDILQTLKAKLPTLVEKMLCGQNINKIGAISSENIASMMKPPWDPVISSLMQDKPKKLPGNPLIVVIPSSPMTSNRHLKWVNLLSNLATVINIPFNLGTSGHRITTTHCVEQMFASIRGQIQEIKVEHPNRNIVIVGFNAGAAMALQVAQSEPVLAVICLGFSLLTVQGRRGELEDSLLELQSPVLFIIGQCSSTASQWEMEDLRERMRIETGLVIVGSADNFLRITKKKKRLEGITQSVVDRCIVDEIGEFISGIILSPFPPLVRQSGNLADCHTRKVKIERKRYNSNTSSLDSEDIISTFPMRITRPVGRPPGSKTKSKLDGRWAAQVVQGTTPQNPPSSSPNSTPPLTPVTLDSSSNDSSLDRQNVEKPVPNFPSKIKTILPNSTDAPPLIKKVRTMKPVVPGSSAGFISNSASLAPSKSLTIKGPPSSGTAKMQAYGLTKHNVISGSRLSSLLQGGIKTIPPSTQKISGPIRVLENVTISTGNTKLFSNTPSKTTNKVNPICGGGIKPTAGNVLILPDGKVKSVGSVNANKSEGNRYITSKKQLLANRPPKPIKRLNSYRSSTISSTLPPPTNLTTQDIMDLPIIFADDNQIVDPTIPDVTPEQPMPTLGPAASKILTPGSKYVLVNKPLTFSASNTNFVITQAPIKKHSNVYRQTPKYTKIILSKRTTEELKASNVISRIANLSPEISVKKICNPLQTNKPSIIHMENIDLENELIATTIPKPMYGGEVRNISLLSHKIVSKQGETYLKTLERMREEKLKRLSSPISQDDDDSDPDYIPPKMIKLN